MYDIRITRFNQDEICDIDFYDRTGLNFVLNNRNIFSRGKVNPHFEFEYLEKIKKNGYKMEGFVADVENILGEDDDDDKDLMVEQLFEKMTGHYTRKYNYVYYYIRISNPKNCRSIVKHIEEKENVVYKNIGEQNIYILDNIVSESVLCGYIEGIIFKENKSHISSSISVDKMNIFNIMALLEFGEMILFKYPSATRYRIVGFSKSL